jgi:hypothetical protein
VLTKVSMSERFDFDSRFLDVAKFTLCLLLYSRCNCNLLSNKELGTGTSKREALGLRFVPVVLY